MVTVEHLLWRYKGRRLSRVEYHILNGAREDQTYKQIAEKFRYSFKYVTSIGRQLWQHLSEVLEKKVTKKNWKYVVKQPIVLEPIIQSTNLKQMTRKCLDLLNRLDQDKIQFDYLLVDSVDDTRSNSTDSTIVADTDNSCDANRFLESVENTLVQKLSLSLDEDVSKANSQAASTAKNSQNTELTLKIFLEIAHDLILQHRGRGLKKVETIILMGVWENKTYEKIIEEDKNTYNLGYIHDVGRELWQQLSEALGENVSKTNWRLAFERKCQQDTQANCTPAQTQFKDRFISFLLNPRNTCAKFVGNIDNNWNFLIKDAVAKIWQRLSKVWHEKATPENWQAAFQLKFARDTKLTEEIVVQVIDSIILHHRKERLTKLEDKVVRGTWQGKTYDKIAEEVNHMVSYIRKDIGGRLWQKLSKAFGEKINKTNFKPTLEQWYENMKLGFA